MQGGLIFLLILVVIGFFIAGPFFTILALNTLFGTGISYSFGTWFAMFWLHILLAAKVSGSKS